MGIFPSLARLQQANRVRESRWDSLALSTTRICGLDALMHFAVCTEDVLSKM